MKSFEYQETKRGPKGYHPQSITQSINCFGLSVTVSHHRRKNFRRLRAPGNKNLQAPTGTWRFFVLCNATMHQPFHD